MKDNQVAVSVLFEKEEKEKAMEWAKKHDIKFAQMVRWSVREYMENHSKNEKDI